MVVNLTFQVQWWDKISRVLQDMNVVVTDMSQPMEQAIEIIQEWVDENFKREWSRTEWKRKELSKATQKARANRWWWYRQSPNNPWILRWTGRMQENVEKLVRRNYGSIQRKTEYAKYHQWWRWVPKRKFIDLNNDIKREVTRIFQKYLYEKWWLSRR